MKQLLLLSLFFFIMFSSPAQKKAVTETGEQVILYEDGTWKYSNDSMTTNSEISTNPIAFKKSNGSTFLLKSTKLNIGIWLNPQKWSFKKAGESEDAEYELTLKGKDLYGLIIPESIEVPLETLKNIALENARSAASDIKIVKEEYRMVNNIKVLFMQMNGSIQGIKYQEE